MNWNPTPNTEEPFDPAPTEPAKRRVVSKRNGLIALLIVFVLLCGSSLVVALSVGRKVVQQVSPTLTHMAKETRVAPSRPAVSQTATTVPAPSVTSTPRLAAATPAPVSYRIWSRSAARTVLYAQPDRESRAVLALPNGAPVLLREEQTVANERWLRVQAEDGEEGWLPERLAFPALPGAPRFATQAVNVRAEPDGPILFAIFEVSTLYLTGETATDEESQEWVLVTLLDGQQGWMAAWLLEEQP